MKSVASEPVPPILSPAFPFRAVQRPGRISNIYSRLSLKDSPWFWRVQVPKLLHKGTFVLVVLQLWTREVVTNCRILILLYRKTLGRVCVCWLYTRFRETALSSFSVLKKALRLWKAHSWDSNWFIRLQLSVFLYVVFVSVEWILFIGLFVV
jgi:hypothetical protein